MFVYITQGKTEHRATIIDPMFVGMLQKMKSNEGKHNYLSHLLLNQQKDDKITIQWHSTGGKEPVNVSSLQLVSKNGRSDRGARRGRHTERYG